MKKKKKAEKELKGWELRFVVVVRRIQVRKYRKLRVANVVLNGQVRPLLRSTCSLRSSSNLGVVEILQFVRFN